jgi:hypothetical protein
LFSLFLDPAKSHRQRHNSVAFAFDVAILVPDYEIDGVLWLKRHFEGGYLVRKLIIVEATRDPGAPAGWRIEYGFQSETPNAANVQANAKLVGDALTFAIPMDSHVNAKPGMHGQLRIEIRQWK